MTDQPAQVFISYKSEDRARVKPLVAALEAEGFSVWWDAHIGGGTNWQKEIEQHLDAAKCVVVAWTKRSVGDDGHFVRDEARRAQRHGVYLPVCLDPVEPPLGFGETQALLLKGWKGDRTDPRFRALADAVSACLSGERSAAAPIHASEPRISRRLVITGGVGTAVIAGAGGWALFKPTAAAASNRIAVMSFSNMSGDPAQAYFSDGIAEELRGALSRVGMQVIGKASCDAVKDLDIPSAAAKLGVANILTGSVRRSPDTIRIGAQLVGGKDGVEKWAQNYDRAPGDTIKIQSDIAEQVAGALSIALGAAKKAALTLGGTANAKAQDLYLQADALSKSADSAEAFQKMIALLDAALAIDPNYGDAHLGKANSLAISAGLYATSPVQLAEMLGRAEVSVKRAASLMPGSGRPGAMFASISASRLDFVAALRGSEQALTAQPNDGFVMRKALNILPWLGDGVQALALADRYIALDPLNPTAYVQRGLCLYVLRRYAEAIDASSKALALAPQRSGLRLDIAQSMILLDRPDEARAVLAKIPPDDVFRQTYEAILAARSGNRAGAEALFAKIRAAYGDAASYQYGEIYTQLGDTDRAFAAFDKAVEAPDPGLLYLKRDPFLDPIRRDPRFVALLTRLKFPA
ncbi:TIR domain-containing protein [Sphingomonas sp.]|uniref:TIR domain-containing protein n=1 Tax=Sphingomonas sp. TaxID=28214 RepID=UPI00374FE506